MGYQRNKVVVRQTDTENKKALKKAHERCLITNNMAKIVKLNKPEYASKNFVVSINSAFKPIGKEHSLLQNQLFSNNEFEAHEEVNSENESQIFKPIALDVRR